MYCEGSDVRHLMQIITGSPGGAGVRDPPAHAGGARDWVWSLGGEDPLEEEVATHSSTLAWRIPWTEEPGGLQSMGSQSQAGLSDWATHTQITYHSPAHLGWTPRLSHGVALLTSLTSFPTIFSPLPCLHQPRPSACMLYPCSPRGLGPDAPASRCLCGSPPSLTSFLLKAC